MNSAPRTPLKLYGLSSALVVILLLCMALVQLPADLRYPGLELLRGQRTLSATELEGFISGMQTIFALDGVFLAAQALAWLGAAALLQGQNQLSARLVLTLGLLGIALDLTENSMALSALEGLQAGTLPPSAWLLTWRTIQHLSYLLPLIAAIIAGAHLPRTGLVVVIGIGFSTLALCGLYLPALSGLPDLWYIAWFGSLSLLLWAAPTRSA